MHTDDTVSSFAAITYISIAAATEFFASDLERSGMDVVRFDGGVDVVAAQDLKWTSKRSELMILQPLTLQRIHAMILHV